MRLEFGSDTIWNCLRVFPMSCDWNLDKTQIGIVLEFFQSDVIGIWITHNFEMS